jgi:hypothetical protein
MVAQQAENTARPANQRNDARIDAKLEPPPIAAKVLGELGPAALQSSEGAWTPTAQTRLAAVNAAGTIRDDGSLDPDVAAMNKAFYSIDGKFLGVPQSPNTDRQTVTSNTDQQPRITDVTVDASKLSGDARKELTALEAHINDPASGLDDQQKKLLEQSMSNIINGKANDGTDRQPPLNDEQKKELFHQANRMFDEQDKIYGQGLSQGDRNRGLTAMMVDSADPSLMNQGQFNTCNGTTVAKVEALDRPEQQAKRFVDMYTNANGDHTVTMPTLDGKGCINIKYDVNSLRGDTTEAASALDAGHVGMGQRDQFVQGMNHLLINDFKQQGNPPLFYTNERPGQFGQQDTGERLRTSDGRVLVDKSGKPIVSPQMSADDVGALEKSLSGKANTMASSSHFGTTDVADIKTPADLQKAFEANGGGPMILAVDTKSALFQAEGVGGNGGGHVVVIAGERMGPGGQVQFKLDNSWGSKYNGWVDANTLFASADPVAAKNQGINPTFGTVPGPETPARGGYGPQGHSYQGTGPQRSSDGITTNTNSQTMDQNSQQYWFQHYEEQQRKDQEDQQRQELIRTRKSMLDDQ